MSGQLEVLEDLLQRRSILHRDERVSEEIAAVVDEAFQTIALSRASRLLNQFETAQVRTITYTGEWDATSWLLFDPDSTLHTGIVHEQFPVIAKTNTHGGRRGAKRNGLLLCAQLRRGRRSANPR